MILEKRGSLSTNHRYTPNQFLKQQVDPHFTKEAKKELQPELTKIRKIETKDLKIAVPKIAITLIQARNLPTLAIIVKIRM
jgi:hypothetical protein